MYLLYVHNTVYCIFAALPEGPVDSCDLPSVSSCGIDDRRDCLFGGCCWSTQASENQHCYEPTTGTLQVLLSNIIRRVGFYMKMEDSYKREKYFSEKNSTEMQKIRRLKISLMILCFKKKKKKKKKKSVDYKKLQDNSSST